MATLYDKSFDRDACGVGFVADIKGIKSRSIVDDGLEILRRLSHRAATGADPDTGDGAGILIQLADRFFRAEAAKAGLDIPNGRRFAVGQMFLPPDPAQRSACEQILADVVTEEGQRVLGWRDVPTDSAHTGTVARGVMPVFRQLYVRMRRVPPSAWVRTLFVNRKLAVMSLEEHKPTADKPTVKSPAKSTKLAPRRTSEPKKPAVTPQANKKPTQQKRNKTKKSEM